MISARELHRPFIVACFNAWYSCVLQKFEGKEIDRDTFFAYLMGNEL